MRLKKVLQAHRTRFGFDVRLGTARAHQLVWSGTRMFIFRVKLLDNDAELADIAMPRPGTQARQALLRELRRLREPRKGVSLRHEALSQILDIPLPLAEWGHTDFHCAEQLVYLAMEAAGGEEKVWVMTGRRDDPGSLHPWRSVQGRAVERTEQQCLFRERHLADLVNKEQTAASRPEKRLEGGVDGGAGELPRGARQAVPRGPVGEEGSVRSNEPVQLSRDLLFAGSGVSADQQRPKMRSDVSKARPKFDRRRAGAV